MRTAMF